MLADRPGTEILAAGLPPSRPGEGGGDPPPPPPGDDDAGDPPP